MYFNGRRGKAKKINVRHSISNGDKGHRARVRRVDSLRVER